VSYRFRPVSELLEFGEFRNLGKRLFHHNDSSGNNMEEVALTGLFRS
jgi:hypothetical protein